MYFNSGNKIPQQTQNMFGQNPAAQKDMHNMSNQHNQNSPLSNISLNSTGSQKSLGNGQARVSRPRGAAVLQRWQPWTCCLLRRRSKLTSTVLEILCQLFLSVISRAQQEAGEEAGTSRPCRGLPRARAAKF